jgi:RNA polymerase sigma-70 factor (ECF subfamily)
MRAVKDDETRLTFERLTFGHMDALYRVALQMTRNSADAENLVQDTYLRAYRFFHKHERGSNLRVWIFTIMRNLFINDYRKNQSRSRDVELDAVDERLDAPPDEAVDAQRVISSPALQMALGSLSEESRTMLVLAYVEGFRYQEIADLMGRPIGTVLSRVLRARQRLRRKLQDQPGRISGNGVPPETAC